MHPNKKWNTLFCPATIAQKLFKQISIRAYSHTALTADTEDPELFSQLIEVSKRISKLHDEKPVRSTDCFHFNKYQCC